MMRGLPGSGKSTKAKEIILENPDTVRINRDLIREMLHFSQWSPSREGTVVELEKMIASYHLVEEGKSVIIDDTNLTPKHEEMWRGFADELQRKGLTDLEFEIIDIDTDPYTCVERDLVREKKVGMDVIYQMALASGRIPDDINYVLCDLDGTLCDLSARRHYVREAPKNWKKFFEEIPNDTLREDVLADVEATLASVRDQGKRAYLVLVSARPENYKKVTEEWLARNDVDYFTLIMRRAGDSREDSIVKREILNKYFKDKSKIIKVFDDRPRVIRMWREEGLEVEDVGDGVEF